MNAVDFTVFLMVIIPCYSGSPSDTVSVNNISKLFPDILQYKLVRDGDVKFYIFNRSFNIQPNPPVADTKSKLDITKPTIFLIHGWIADRTVDWYKEITEEFLKNKDCNVIQVDWKEPSRSWYISSAMNTKVVGEQIAHFIKDLALPPKNVHLIGHSLGGHVAGFAGKEIKATTGQRFRRITGLDPAGPWFWHFRFYKDWRLDREDADIVDVMHTDAGIYGTDYIIGSFDIIVNGGHNPQPGCWESMCSHCRAYTYFKEWINGGKFKCTICSPWWSNNCRFLEIGEEDIDEHLTGICYTGTNIKQPFLQ